MYETLIIIFNLTFLARYAIGDIRTHTIPRIATLFFVIVSLCLSNWLFIAQSVVVCLVMYGISKQIVLSTGDRKIIFGLSLQYGGMLGVALLFVTVVVLYLLGKNGKHIALIPYILGGYIAYMLNGFVI